MTRTFDTLHPDDILFFHEVSEAMWKVARAYGLPLKQIVSTGEPLTGGTGVYGRCHVTGLIEICFRPKDANGEWCSEPFSPEEIWDTASHELAHLRHHGHGVAFAEFHQELRTAINNKKKDHRQAVIDKLVKMQAHRDSAAKMGSSEEAEAFARNINRLLVTHEINATELDYARASDDDPVVEIRLQRDTYGIKKKGSRVAWEEELASVVANAHLCRILVVPGSNQIIFVGTRSHALVAEYTYGTLAPLAGKLATQEYDRFWLQCKAEDGHAKRAAGFRGSWLDAFVGRIREKFEDARKSAVAEEAARHGGTSSETALIRLSGALTKVRSYIDAKFEGKRASAGYLCGNSVHNRTGAERGRAAADRLTMRRGVTGGSRSSGKMLGDGR